MTTKEMTLREIVQLMSTNYDEVEKVWAELGKIDGGAATLLQATIEWAKRNGQEIKVKDSKEDDEDNSG